MDGTIFIIFIIIYAIITIYPIFFPQKRLEDKELSEKIRALRDIPVKNLEQQKEFVTLKNNPSKNPVKKTVTIILVSIFLMITLGKLFSYLNFKVSFFTGLILILSFPIVLNIVLHLLGLTHTSVLTYLGWKK